MQKGMIDYLMGQNRGLHDRLMAKGLSEYKTMTAHEVFDELAIPFNSETEHDFTEDEENAGEIVDEG
jgi:hypothetical protein